MYGLPADFDFSFFIGKTLNVVSFATGNVYFEFEGKVLITIMSSFQHRQKADVEHFRVGVMQSIPLMQSSLMVLLDHKIVTAAGDSEGTLSLTFDDGQVLNCFDSSKAYESYTFTDGEHEFVV